VAIVVKEAREVKRGSVVKRTSVVKEVEERSAENVMTGLRLVRKPRGARRVLC
jgi:hypothetical protein